jgi:SAM-dependent methyltransferase
MTWIDTLGQRWRIARASSYIPAGSRVLDIGCGDGALFRSLGTRISGGIGVDPDASDRSDERFLYIRGMYPDDSRQIDPVDAIVALAMLEHVPVDRQRLLADACFGHLVPGGRLVITVPSPAVDPIIRLLQRLHLGDAETFEQHYGFEPWRTRPLFEAAGFVLEVHRRFELGLNHLFVFTRP